MKHVNEMTDGEVRATLAYMIYNIHRLGNEWEAMNGIGGSVPDAACRMRRRLLGEESDATHRE